MCWLTKAWPSTTRVIVFFRSAPSARIGRCVGKACHRAGSVAAGAAQNRLGPNAPTRTTESSTRRAMGRSPIRNASAMPDEPLQRVFIFVSDRLARAVGAGHDQHFGSAGSKEQMVQRSVGQHHAQFVVVRGDSARSFSAARARSAAR